MPLSQSKPTSRPLGHTENAGLIGYITGVYLLCINRDGSNITDKPNAVLMSGHRLRRWPTLNQHCIDTPCLPGTPLWLLRLTFVVTQKLWIAVARHNLQVSENYNDPVKFNDLDLLFFTELANTKKYGGEVFITLFSPSDVTVFHRMKYGGAGVI